MGTGGATGDGPSGFGGSVGVGLGLGDGSGTILAGFVALMKVFIGARLQELHATLFVLSDSSGVGAENASSILSLKSHKSVGDTIVFRMSSTDKCSHGRCRGDLVYKPMEARSQHMEHVSDVLSGRPWTILAYVNGWKQLKKYECFRKYSDLEHGNSVVDSKTAMSCSSNSVGSYEISANIVFILLANKFWLPHLLANQKPVRIYTI